MAFLIGVDGKSREVTDMYIGVDGKARRVFKGFIGVNGVSRVFYGGAYQPDVGENVVALSSEGSYLADTVFVKGRYRVDIGGWFVNNAAYSKDNCFSQEVSVTEPFIIKAFCHTNDGESLVETANGDIFGGRGGYDASVSGGDTKYPNALGSACCHFMPIDGVFGKDYYYCFHCGASPKGGAYGGGAGGRGSRMYNSAIRGYMNYTGGTGTAGKGGAGGKGGTGTINGQPGAGVNGSPGSSGFGIGAGTATSGGVAFYNGSIWTTPSRKTNANGVPYITVTYLGKL